MGTLRVTGKGTVRVKPDTTRLSITLTGIYPSYAVALEMSAGMTEEMKDVIEKLGFERTDLKTVFFNIDSKYESVRDRNDNYKSVFKGYEFDHRVKLEFPVDNTLLGRILFEMAQLTSFPKLSIGYLVRDTEGPKAEMLRNAVADAGKKAEILSEAAGVRLGAIRDINYSWGEIRFGYEAADEMLLCEDTCRSNSYNLDIEPDEIEKTDTVTIEWELES